MGTFIYKAKDGPDRTVEGELEVEAFLYDLERQRLLGGYRVQGRDQQQAEGMLRDAVNLQDAGAQLLVLECVPQLLAAEITRALDIPVIGIGAGRETDAQVLVLQDVLGITPGQPPRFVHDFMKDADSIADAIRAYVKAVKSGAFPSEEHCFS